jgi:FKBP-type peptidyl-prolyl cis-trans isomerase FklB
MRVVYGTFFFLCFFLFVAEVTGQKSAAKPATTSPQKIKLQTLEDSVQYTLGAFMALWIMNNGFSISNPTLFSRGLDDILQNRPRIIPDSAIESNLIAYRESVQKAKASSEEQLLFATIKDKPGVGMFPNGVRYIILKNGKTTRPSITDSIVVNLIAKLPDGTVVEDTYQSKKPFHATPVSFFAGLNEALQMMTEGAKWQLFVPAKLAYADKGTSFIPPNSALILEVELMEIRPVKK